MTIALNQVVIRNEWRVRLVFTGAVASGAFNSSLYVLSDVTLSQPGPTVKAALSVFSNTNQVELVLTSPLTQGHGISVNCTNVPAADLSSFTGNSSAFYGQNVTFTPNAEPAQSASDDLVFGVDLVHNGTDYVEDATGDLAVVTGLQNVQGALFRKCLAYGLPWDQNYGPRLDDYVDGPAASAATATGLIQRQMLADDRVNGCTCTFNPDGTPQQGAYFSVFVTLKTNKKLPAFDVSLKAVSSSGGNA